ncbi:MAG: hypothetical protein LH467_06720 [Gemmatimonadaceae bacterium]|nr:hypothetical protein [Gemmatimonadaceae bacterium]
MLYVMLTPDALTPPETALTALLATTGTPVAVELRSAEQFTMRRTSDGSRFAWREVEASRTGRDGRPRYAPSGGNYLLAERASVAGLGRENLSAGSTYTIEVATQGRLITGSVTIPARPVPSLVQEANRRRVVWPRAAAAALYLLEIDTAVVRSVTVRDTFYVLHDDRDSLSLPPIPKFRLTAVDSNWSRFMSDSTVTSAGLRGAYGLFGAFTSVELELPRLTGATRSARAPHRDPRPHNHAPIANRDVGYSHSSKLHTGIH